MPSPCPCRGCLAAYKAGYDDGYTQGRNEQAASREIGLEMYGYVQHGKGENP